MSVVLLIILGSQPSLEWPTKGEIQFKNVSLRYDTNLEPVVFGINLIIKAGQKVRYFYICI